MVVRNIVSKEPLKIGRSQMTSTFNQCVRIACLLAAIGFCSRAVAGDAVAANTGQAADTVGTFTVNSVETTDTGPADVPDPQSESMARMQLELTASELNQLFPPKGVWLSGQFRRPNPYRFDQAQKFTGNFQKTPEGDYEQPGFCEQEWFTNGQGSGKDVETTTHKLTVENGKVVVYAIHVNQAGQRNVYGPSNVAREGNAIVFRDMNPAAVSGGNWVQSTFFRKRDGTLGSTRHWNADYFDDWVASDPPAADK